MSLSDKQLKQIRKDYEALRLKHKHTEKNRLSAIKKEIPRMQSILEEMADTSLHIAGAITGSPNQTKQLLEQLKAHLYGLKAEKQKLLLEHGYAHNYLDPIYTCQTCKDTGYINQAPCHCYKQACINLAYAQSNLQGILATENFDSFKLDYYAPQTDSATGISPRANAESVYRYCKNFCSPFLTPYDNLILYGHAGLGKTFLCNSIAKALLDQGKTVLYLTAFHLFRLLETYRFHNSEHLVTYDQIDDLYTCDLLIIDDLGSEVINQFTTSELFNVLNTRILKKNATVISTNLEPSGWSKHYSDRIVSRIFGHYTPLKLIGQDIRLMAYDE